METREVNVTLPALLAQCVGGAAEVQVRAETLAGALEALVRAYPLLRVHLYDDTGAQRQHVLILYNGQSIRWFPSLDLPLTEGDTISILQLVSGG